MLILQCWRSHTRRSHRRVVLQIFEDSFLSSCFRPQESNIRSGFSTGSATNTAGNRLIQIDANDILGFKFVRDRAVTHASNHGCQAFALFHKIFITDWIVETLTQRNIAKLDTATDGLSSHANSLKMVRGLRGSLPHLHFADLTQPHPSLRHHARHFLS